MTAKDPSIARLLEALSNGAHGAVPVDTGASNSVDLTSPSEARRLVHVTTQDPDAERYDYECFLPDGPSAKRPVRWGKNVTIERLLEVAGEHVG
ncbi:MAG: hypothetical protein U0230_20395 [Polyangiales bacterium]